MAVMPLRKPADLNLPGKAGELAALFGSLPSDDQRRVLEDLLESMEASKQDDDLRPLLAVIESWYRTVLLRRDPDHERLVEEAKVRAERGFPHDVKYQTVDELRAEVAARRPSQG